MTYEWDARKAESNRRKHGVAFEEAASVFLDPLAETFQDPGSPTNENREITIGCTLRGRMVFVSHCERGAGIRIISARLVTRAEREEYEKGIDG